MSDAVSEPEPVLPDGCPEIVFNLSDHFLRIHDDHDETQPCSLIAGQITRSILIRPTGRVDLFGIRFTPSGASQIFGFAMSELTNQILDLDTLLGSVSFELEEKVNAARSFDARVAVFEEFALDRLATGSDLDPLAIAACEIISRTSGRSTVASLVGILNISERQFERRFKRSVGLSPKMFARIVRFQAAVRRFQTGSAPNFLDAALEFGYFDQSHLIRDFKEFSGVTPLVFFERNHTISDVFTGAL